MSKLCRFYSELGWVEVAASEDSVVGVYLVDSGPEVSPGSDLLGRARDQIIEFFSGDRRDFDLPLAPEGSKFSQAVWRVLSGIPYGGTVTYSDVAKASGYAKAVRAVGAACGRNPLAIVVPCHRVVPKSGGLGGYAYGTAAKKFLLQLEGHGQL